MPGYPLLVVILEFIINTYLAFVLIPGMEPHWPGATAHFKVELEVNTFV